MEKNCIEGHKQADVWIAALISVFLTGISSLRYYEIFAREGSLLEKLQEFGAVFFLPGLFVSMIMSGNIHGGSLEIGAGINFFIYALISYAILRWYRRRRSRKGHLNG